MTRANAARARNLEKGRRILQERRSHGDAVKREIVTLRSQIAAELNKHYGGSGLNVQLGTITEEYVPELRTHTSRVAVLDQMVNDPIIRGQVRAIDSTIRSSVRWRLVGGSARLQELCSANLLRQGPRKYWCSTSWNDRLYESLGMLVHGFALFAKTRGQADDGSYFFSDLKWLHPRSVQDFMGWEMDANDDLVKVNRLYTDALGMTRQDSIPAANVFIVPWDRRGPNWEGNAFIRPMYKPWKMGNLAEKIDIVDLQNRGVGIPMAKLSGAGGTKERDTLVEILKSLRGGSKERAFIVLQKDEDVSFLTSQGEAKDAGPIIDRHRSGIVKSAGTEYLEAGNTGTGSRAASSSMAAGFFIQVNAIAKHLEDIYNHGAGTMPGLVEELCLLTGDDDEEWPTLEASNVSPTEQLDNIPLLLDSVQKGAVPRSMKLANWITDRLAAPTLTKAEYDESVGGRSTVDTGTVSGAPEASGGAGRPAGATNSTLPPDPRDDAASRRLGLQAEKKTPCDGSPLTRKRASSAWLESTPS